MIPALTVVLTLAADIKPQVLKELTAAEIDAVKAKARPGATVTGTHRAVEAKLLGKGQWQKAAHGTRVWRWAIRSPKAVGLRLHFVDFQVGNGQVWIETVGAKRERYGPYSGAGYNRDGDFWSDAVFADTVTVEYRPADSRSRTIPFKIREISHMFRSPLE